MSMASKPKGNGSTESQATSVKVVPEEASTRNLSPDEEIRRRAYEIYFERGEQLGSELDDWLQAERELARGVLSRAQAG
jgi:oligoendopeptidase F